MILFLYRICIRFLCPYYRKGSVLLKQAFQHFVRNIYSDSDAKFLEKLRKQYDDLPRGSVLSYQAVKPDEIKHYAQAWNPDDPLYHDEDYGSHSFWNSMIAFPFFSLHQPLYPRFPHEFGDKHYFGNCGGEVEYFQPIRPGDTISTLKAEQHLEDITTEERPELRVFSLSGTALQYNQNGDLVCRYHTSGQNAFLRYADGSPERRTFSYYDINAEWAACAPPTHVTTPEEWELIEKLWAAEELRGEHTRYWEDVKIGDQIPPVCTGPITELDMFRLHGSDILRRGGPKKFRERNIHTQDPYGMWQPTFYPCFAGHPDLGVRPCFYSWTARNFAIRAVTNYMSDMGEIRKIRWQSQQLYPALHVPDAGRDILDLLPETRGRVCQRIGQVGDTCICLGTVIHKDIVGQEHQVRLVVWVETLDHVILQALDVTLCLPSRNHL